MADIIARGIAQQANKAIITEARSSFFRGSNKNLLNMAKVLSTSYASPTDGTVAYDPVGFTYYASDYIPIQPSLPYVCTKNIRSVAYYDANKVFVSGVNTVINGSTPFTTPAAGVAFMRVNLYMGDDQTRTQLEQNNAPTSYEPYYVFSGYVVGSSKWKDKSFVSLGDSITWQDGKIYTQGPQNGFIARGYQTVLKDKLGFASYNNQGMDGKPMANGTANGAGIHTTGKGLTYTSYDLVIIAAGTNDFKLNVALGTKGLIGDTAFDTNTFYGAYRDLIEYILTNKPSVRVVLFTPLQRNNGGYDVNTVNTAGHKLIDYVNAVKDIGEMYGIPVCDLYRNSGITAKTLATLTLDGLHPNDLGHARIGGYAASFVDAL